MPVARFERVYAHNIFPLASPRVSSRLFSPHISPALASILVIDALHGRSQRGDRVTPLGRDVRETAAVMGEGPRERPRRPADIRAARKLAVRAPATATVPLAPWVPRAVTSSNRFFGRVSEFCCESHCVYLLFGLGWVFKMRAPAGRPGRSRAPAACRL